MKYTTISHILSSFRRRMKRHSCRTRIPPIVDDNRRFDFFSPCWAYHPRDAGTFHPESFHRVQVCLRYAKTLSRIANDREEEIYSPEIITLRREP